MSTAGSFQCQRVKDMHNSTEPGRQHNLKINTSVLRDSIIRNIQRFKVFNNKGAEEIYFGLRGGNNRRLEEPV
jgi:flagellar biosynthesis/type III secretory pathway chaperone